MSKSQKILIVEDEESLAIGLEYNLAEEGYSVDIAADGREALRAFSAGDYDMIILDIMLPYHDGFEVAERVRQSDPQLPILMLTARTTDKDRIKGLEAGADDYLTKPFNLKELLLRVRRMLERKAWYQSSTSKQPVVQFGDNTINFANMSATTANKSIQLTQHEALVLKYLIDHKNQVVSRQELLENVWHTNPDVETRTVDNFIVRLRRYFEPAPNKPKYFKSIRSAGYMFQKEDK